MGIESNLLYFPFMRVPKEEWLTRSLLYWEKLYLIVPREIISFEDDYTKELHERGLVEYVHPENYLAESRARGFALKFINLMDIVPWKRWRIADTSEGADHLPDNLVRFYDSKFTYSVRSQLETRGLMREVRGTSWLEMHPCTAYMYMGCLAAYLSDRLPDCRPVTNSTSYLLRSPDRPQEEGRQRLDESRAIVLDGILPAPQGGISARDIAKFKDEHKTVRREFRSEIEMALTHIADIDDPVLRQRSIDIFLGDVHDRIENINEAGHSRGWNMAKAKFTAIGTYSLPFAGPLAAFFSLPYANLIAAFGSFLGIALILFSREGGERTVVDKFAYAHQAQKALT